jgi:uncharacterized repeat protein (TIGR01451 family)
MKNLFAIFLFCISAKAMALDPSHFTITRITAPYFIVDGNSPATLTKAYVGFEVKNNSNSATTYTGLKFTMTSIGTTVSGQNYSIVSPATGIVNIGTLAPGETKVCYYYVAYPAHTTAQGTCNVQLSDNSAQSKTQSFVIINRSSISANAGGTATQTITNQDLIGGVITDDVVYVVGNVQNGDENDFQVAVSTQFDPTKVTLLSTKVIASSIPGINSGTTDSLYFISGNGSNGATVTVRWTFKISATNFTTYLLPCAGATSGSTNYKYALNTGLGQGTPITISSSANPLTITKTSDQSVYGYNSTAIFTITISNPAAFNVSIDKITDELPLGFTFQSFDASSHVSLANSTTIPSAGATGNINFEGGVSSGDVTSYVVPAGGSLVVKYSALSPAYDGTNLTTTARDYVGVTEIGSAQNTVSVSGTLPLSLLSFKGNRQTDQVKLEWSTAFENNTKHFEIERSIGNNTFTRIGQLTAAGSSISNMNYSFVDHSIVSANLMYRLKMVDKDGTFKYSPILFFPERSAQQEIQKIVNNPFYNEFGIVLTSDKKVAATIILSDVNGRTIRRKSETLNYGVNNFIFGDLENLLPGTYIIQVITGETMMKSKVVKLN